MTDELDDDLSFDDRPKGIEKIWAGAAPASPRPETPRAMVARHYGKGPRGGLNTKAAAEDLGVSQRTVQRWIKDRRMPETSEGGDRLKQKHEAWKESPDGRRSALGRKRKDELLAARTVNMNGQVKVSKDVRPRTGLEVGITEGDMARVVDALASGDDAGAYAILEDVFGDAFGGSVGLSFEKVWFE